MSSANLQKIEPDAKFWTMVGKRPKLLTVIRKYELAPMFGDKFHKVHLWCECCKNVYERSPEELFETYEELRDDVFPPNPKA